MKKLQIIKSNLAKGKYCRLAVFSFICISCASSQTALSKNDDFIVKYNVDLPYNLQRQNEDSVTIKINGKKSKGNISIPDSVQMSVNEYPNLQKESFQKSFIKGKVSLYYEVKGNADSSVINMVNKTLPQHVNINTPDLFYYTRGKWFVNKNGKVADVAYYNVVYKKQTTAKNILGYQCTNVLIVDQVMQDTLGEMWVSRDLPPTIMPFAGYQLQSGAVLEFSNYSTGIKAIAVDIAKMNK